MELEPYKDSADIGFLPLWQHCESRNLLNDAQRVQDLCILKVINFYCAVFVAFFGIVSNLLIIFTLSKSQSSASVILYQALAIFDIVFLITAPNFIVPQTWYVKFVVGSTKKIAISVLLLLTIERFLVVRNPLRQNWFTVKRTLIVLLKIIFTWMFVVLQTATIFPGRWIPELDEYSLRAIEFIRFEVLPYRYNAVFEWIVEFLLPWPLLLGLNLTIIFLVRRAVSKRKDLAKDQKTDNSTTRCLVTVVVCYLILEVCRNLGSFLLLMTLTETSRESDGTSMRGKRSRGGGGQPAEFQRNLNAILNLSYAYFTMAYVGNVLSMLNSSINLYIYILTGSKFRRMLIGKVKSMFTTSGSSNNQSSQGNSTKVIIM